jgi:hypothetical protein
MFRYGFTARGGNRRYDLYEYKEPHRNTVRCSVCMFRRSIRTAFPCDCERVRLFATALWSAGTCHRFGPYCANSKQRKAVTSPRTPKTFFAEMRLLAGLEWH